MTFLKAGEIIMWFVENWIKKFMYGYKSNEYGISAVYLV